MTFDDWWGAYPTQEDYEANCRDAWEAGAASRDAEVAKLKDDNEYLYVAAIERDQLREQVKMLLGVILKQMASENRWPNYSIEALAATEPK